jgi:hypothetical protein
MKSWSMTLFPDRDSGNGNTENATQESAIRSARRASAERLS